MTFLDTMRGWVSTPGPTMAVDIAADGVSAVAVDGAAAAVAGHAQAPLPAGVVTPAATAANVRDLDAAAAAVRDVLGRLPRRRSPRELDRAGQRRQGVHSALRIRARAAGRP